MLAALACSGSGMAPERYQVIMKRFISSILIAGAPLVGLLAADELKIYPAAEIEFTTVAGATYRLQGSSNMLDWLDCEDPIPGDGATVNRLLSIKGTHHRFFRVLTELPPVGALTNYSECKSANPLLLQALDTPSNDRECLQFTWDGNGTLVLRHINAGFNCCPDQLLGSVAIQDGAITLTESELHGLCFCLCLYDLDYEILHLKPGLYTLQVAPTHYVPSGDPPLTFAVDLTAPTNGIYCVPRSAYPWHTPAPTGVLTSYGACKNSNNVWSASPPNAGSPASNEGCLEYQYDANTGTLLLTHVNAAFNCCPSNIQAQVTIAPSQIDITESESAGGCRCLCLYDLSYEIQNLIPNTYTISLTEPNLPKTDPKLTFTLDLITNSIGRLCFPRSAYPWGN